MTATPVRVTTSSLAARVASAIASVTGGAAALHEPRFEGNERKYILECLDSTFVSSVGEYVNRFERQLAAFTGAKHAVAVSNGTVALEVSMRLAGVNAGEEVIVPALTFVATAAAVMHCGAVPHIAECDERTLGLDPDALRAYLAANAELRGDGLFSRKSGRRIRAVVPMHTFGHPCDIAAILALATDFGLVVVEDAAESLGSRIGERHAGTFGLLSTLSFNGNKTITTGGGGAILTNDEQLARRAKHLTTTARVPHRWAFIHDEVGYNYRLPNINAALGCAQMERLPEFILAKRRLRERYAEALAGVPGLRVFEEPDGCTSNYWLQTLVLEESSAHERDSILAATNDAGIMTRPAWTLLHRMKPYADCPRMPLPVAESLERRIINLPSSPHVGRSEREGCRNVED